MSHFSTPLDRRPGLVTFAAVMMFVLFGLYAIVAFMEFAHATWLLFSPYNGVGGSLLVWGIVDAILALILLYAGIDILAGGEVGRIIGLVFAVLSAIRWFFYLPIAPVSAVVFMALSILVIYGLVAHGEYFRSDAGKMTS